MDELNGILQSNEYIENASKDPTNYLRREVEDMQ
jgi:hypothetical protein